MDKKDGEKLRKPLKRSARLVVILALSAALAAVFFVFVSFLGHEKPRQTLLDNTILQLEEDVKTSPNTVAPRLAVAIAYAARGMHNEAVEQFQEALKLNPTNQHALIGLGVAQMNRGDDDAAMQAFMQVADLNKDNPVKYTIQELETVYYNLGNIYLKRKDYSTAVEQLEEALKINRTDADAIYLLGMARQKMGDLSGAEQAYIEATTFVPNFLDAYERLMEIYKSQGNEALYSFAQGMTNVSKRRYETAISQLQKSLNLEPGYALAYQGLGIAYEATGNIAEAKRNYQFALNHFPHLLPSQLGLRRLTPPEEQNR